MVNSHKSQIMLNSPVLKALIFLSLPTMFGMFSIFFINLVDAYYIGLLGVLPLAAVSFSLPIIFIMMSFSIGIAIGVAAVVSRFLGSSKLLEAKNSTSNTLFLKFVTMIFISIIGISLITPIFHLMGAEGELLELIHDYMLIWFFGTPFFGVLVISNSAIRSFGDSLTPGLILFLTSLVNAVLDPILIFGLGPITPLGIKGAALATVLSYMFGMLLMMIFLKRINLLSLPNLNLNELFLSVKAILFVGLPASLTMMLQPLILIYVVVLVSFHGNDAIAAFGIGSRIESFAMIGIIAIASTQTSFIGQNLGAKKYDRVKKGLYYNILFTICWGVLIALPLILLRDFIAVLFSENFLVQEKIKLYILIVGLSYPFFGLSNIASGAFNAFQMPFNATLIWVIRLFLITIPLVYLGNIVYGFLGILVGISLANIISSFYSIVWARLILFKYLN